MRTLQGRVAVVTGAGSGIGQATSELLARRGCHLALVDLDEAGLADTEARLHSLGRQPSTHVVDVADADRMAALADEVVDRHGGCHILVNNAGVTSAGRFEEDRLDDIAWMIGINVWGVLHGCRFFLPALREADEAHIVNLSSMVALVGLPHNAAYSLTKGAVRAFTEALRAELVDSSIGVTAVFPGAVRTNIMFRARGAEGERLATMAAHRLAPLVMRPPAVAARQIVRSIERNRPRALVGPDARLFDLSARILPSRSGLVGRAINRLTG